MIRALARDEYKYFWVDLMIKIKKLLPEELDEDLSKKYILVTKEEHEKYHLLGYEKFSKELGKNHKKASKELAKILIDYYSDNPDCKKDLLQLIVENINTVLPDHNDSVDCNVVLMYLQKDIENNGYHIMSLAPLRIEKIAIQK